jgi:CRISPR-associated exonuclease Cas4
MSTGVFWLLCFLFALAIVLLALSKYQRRQSGLPEGEIVYEDVSGLAKEPLYSQRMNLSGKPDYLLKDPWGNLIPVEVKSSSAPKGDQPFESHLMQLAVYFFLIEDVLQEDPPYGLIRYRNRTIQVDNDDELRERLFDVIAQMRNLLARGEAHRTHDQASRCARCSMSHACSERLA